MRRDNERGQPSLADLHRIADAESTPFVTASGALTVTWTIEARAHLLAAARILELDPARRYQARHLFGVASRLDVAA